MFLTTVSFLMFVKSFANSYSSLILNSIRRGLGADICVLYQSPWKYGTDRDQGAKPLRDKVLS